MQISEILAPQRLVEPEALLVLARHLLDAALHIAAQRRLLQQLGAHRILPREARQEEIERGGEPDDQQENAEAARDVGGLHYTGQLAQVRARSALWAERERLVARADAGGEVDRVTAGNPATSP